MQNRVSKIVFFLLTLVLVGWFGYHLFYYDTDIVSTQSVFKETISRSISGTGIAFRNEQTINKKASGSPRYIYEDGTRVGVNQVVVEYYSGSVENRKVQNISQYQNEISQLEEAANKGLNNFSTASIISRDIREQTANLAFASAVGDCDGINSIKDNLTQLVNRREVAIGNIENYEPRIEQLESEISKLKSSESISSIYQTSAPVSGYFAKKSDGYEKTLSTDILTDYNIEDFIKVIEEPLVTPPNDTDGKIIPDSVWYFAISAPAHEVEWVRVGQTVNLKLSHISKPVPGVVNQLVIENNNENAVIVFASDYISEDIVNLRIADVIIDFTQFSGLKIDTSTVRFQKDEEGNMIRGVYVLDNHQAKFKKINEIYGEEGFILSETYYSNAQQREYVKIYDQIIVQGDDIYDGKVIE